MKVSDQKFKMADFFKFNPLLLNNAFWRLWNTMYLKTLWKMEHLLFGYSLEQMLHLP